MQNAKEKNHLPTTQLFFRTSSDDDRRIQIRRRERVAMECKIPSSTHWHSSCSILIYQLVAIDHHRPPRRLTGDSGLKLVSSNFRTLEYLRCALQLVSSQQCHPPPVGTKLMIFAMYGCNSLSGLILVLGHWTLTLRWLWRSSTVRS